MKISLIRHGESSGNLSNYLNPGIECKLTENGEISANKLSGIFPIHSKIICSPFQRAIETAAIVFPNVEFAIDERLAEIDYGLYGVKNKQNFDHTKYINYNFPGGESYLNVLTRVSDLLEELVREGYESYCLFTHGGVICSVLQSIEKNFNNFPLYNIEYCGYVTLKENNEIEKLSGISRK